MVRIKNYGENGIKWGGLTRISTCQILKVAISTRLKGMSAGLTPTLAPPPPGAQELKRNISGPQIQKVEKIK